MPNWCVGDLRVRGKKDNVIAFLKNELYVGNRYEALVCLDNCIEEGILFVLEEESIYGSGKFNLNFQRGFFNEYHFWIDDETQVATGYLADIKFAWAVKADKLAEISKKYNLDFRIYAFERGMPFNQDIEIRAGFVVKDDCIEYRDYDWDCIYPSLGG